MARPAVGGASVRVSILPYAPSGVDAFELRHRVIEGTPPVW
jgi:hypothetical protein